MSEFFIRRPIFAWVLAITVMLGGLLALRTLPVAQYPEIAPTTISIFATYPGADARTVENSVTRVIEQGMTGVDNLQYMSASSESTGEVEIRLTFTNRADPDVAQMQVQNKLQLVTSQLPTIVQTSGLTVTKSSASFLMVVGFASTDGKLDSADLDDFVVSAMNDTIKRVPGVGNTQLFGAAYAMRIWLDPAKLHRYALMPGDIEGALRAQNAQVAAGQLGAQPAVPGQQLNATVTAQSRLQTPAQFGNVIVKSGADGAIVRLRDVARIELGAETYTYESRYNGMPASGLGVNLAPGANAIDTARAVKAAIASLSGTMPKGVQVFYPYDTTPFVTLSIEEVVKTLIEAVVLVFIVMFVFLQSVRATLIPALAIPVVLLGTLGVLALAGYSINTLTMFAMVLAIGLLVDDAIVVVENVERVMHEEGLSPREATRKSMREITGALVGIATVLSAVFVPMAFFSGSTGIIYRQFSVTIVTAMLLSVLVAMVLTPALCATLLKRGEDHAARRGLAGWFNRHFDRGALAYRRGVQGVLARGRRFLLLFVLLVAVTGWMFVRLPGSFLPVEDQGTLITAVQLPAGAMRDRTEQVLSRVTDYYLKDEKHAVEGVMTVAGYGFGGSGQNVGIAFIRMKDFKDRRRADWSAQAVAQRAQAAFSAIRDAQVYALLPPAIDGMGTSNGFDFFLQDVNGAGHERLNTIRDRLLAAAGKSPLLANTRPNGQEDTPQFAVEVDQSKASTLGLNLADVNTTLSVAWGSDYVNDFIDRGRVKRVYVQSDAGFRMPRSLVRARLGRRDGAVLLVRGGPLELRRDAPGALQRHVGAGDPGRGRAGRELRRRDARDRPAGGLAAGGFPPRVDRLVLRGAAVGQPGHGAVRDLGAGGVPVPGRLVRELVDPVRGDAVGAGGHRRRAGGGLPVRADQRRLFQGRPVDHHRPGGQERDPDRRVRAGTRGARREPAGSHARRRAAAPAADPDDLVRLHPRRAAAGAREGRGLGRAERDRGGRAGRDDRGHGAGDLLRAAAVRERAAGVRGAGAGGMSGARSNQKRQSCWCMNSSRSMQGMRK